MLGESKLRLVRRKHVFAFAAFLLVLAFALAVAARLWSDLARMLDGYGIFFALLAALFFVVAVNRDG